MPVKDTQWSTENNPWTRRQVLTGAGAAGTMLLAGCGGGDDGNGGGNGNGGGSGNGGGNGPAAMGDVVTGDFVSIAFEYLEPANELWDYGFLGNSVAGTDSLVPPAELEEESVYYAMGVAVTNTSETVVNPFLHVQLEGFFASEPEFDVARSQQLSLSPGRTERALVPGETIRGELILALEGDPSEYVVMFFPTDPETGEEEQLSFDLGGGSDGSASFGQDVAATPTGEAISVGPFETVLDSLEIVDSVEGTDRPDVYGPREGARYLLVDLTTTRTAEDLLFAQYDFGLASEDGYDFFYQFMTYEDALDADRGTPFDLGVGETMENLRLALLVEDGFEPDYLTITGSEPLDDGGWVNQKAFWRIP